MGALILGVLFAMAFCPTSGMLYFGMLIPMSAVESGGYVLPVVYAIATSLPVLVAAWIIAYSMQSLGKVMGKIAIFQRWFNRFVAILFILVGEAYLSGEHWYAVPLAVVLAVPMYANAAGIVPVVQVFVAKGVALGTALAFMMSVVGLSLPEATMLKKVMNMKLIGIFFGTIALFIILLGWLFNMVL